MTHKWKKTIMQKANYLFQKVTRHKPHQNKAEMVNDVTVTEEFERCAICGRLTCIPVSMPVDWRENYEIGIGQICARCAGKPDKAEIKENILSDDQVLLAVEQSREEPSECK